MQWIKFHQVYIIDKGQSGKDGPDGYLRFSAVQDNRRLIPPKKGQGKGLEHIRPAVDRQAPFNFKGRQQDRGAEFQGIDAQVPEPYEGIGPPGRSLPRGHRRQGGERQAKQEPGS
ncbi:hypothetical protein ES707_15843 [subsurface metagenome]